MRFRTDTQRLQRTGRALRDGRKRIPTPPSRSYEDGLAASAAQAGAAVAESQASRERDAEVPRRGVSSKAPPGTGRHRSYSHVILDAFDQLLFGGDYEHFKQRVVHREMSLSGTV